MLPLNETLQKNPDQQLRVWRGVPVFPAHIPSKLPIGVGKPTDSKKNTLPLIKYLSGSRISTATINHPGKTMSNGFCVVSKTSDNLDYLMAKPWFHEEGVSFPFCFPHLIDWWILVWSRFRRCFFSENIFIYLHQS